jgi:hypothetical protein
MSKYTPADYQNKLLDEQKVDVTGQSKSTLFLIEQLVVIFIFVAGNAAESYISAGGDVHYAVQFLGGINDQTDYNGNLIVYYNEQWEPSEKEQASYVLSIIKTDNPAPALIIAEVTVSRADGEDLFDMTIAAREDAR